MKQQRETVTLFIPLVCKDTDFTTSSRKFSDSSWDKLPSCPGSSPCHWWLVKMVTHTSKNDLLYVSQKVVEKWQNRMLLNDKTYLEVLFKNLSLFIIKVTRLFAYQETDCKHRKFSLRKDGFTVIWSFTKNYCKLLITEFLFYFLKSNSLEN